MQSDDVEDRGEVDMPGLVSAQAQRVEALQHETESLRASIDQELNARGDIQGDDGEHELAAGTEEVRGTGVEVVLTDAPVPEEGLAEGMSVDDYVVHQQDLEGVINALWAGGAEAMSVQGQRVGATTPLRCVGNVLFIEGQVYSPPYRIAAVGEPDELQASLDQSQAVQIYRSYAHTIGLGYEVVEHDELTIPGYPAPASLQFAQPLEESQ